MPASARVLCPSLNLEPPRTPPHLFDSAMQHFASVPWCAAVLRDGPGSPASDDKRPPVIAFIPQSFNPASDRHDQLLGVTLANAPRGLRHMLCLFRPDDALHVRDPSRPVTRVAAFFAVGSGLSGYEGILHGGLAATIMDETLGTINELNKALGKSDAQYRVPIVTASLDLAFRRPIPVGCDVCVTAWVERVDGRKAHMRCELAGPDGAVLASATSTWIALKPRV